MRILYHHRTAAEDGQAVHVRALIEAFRAAGHALEELALVRRSGPDPGRPSPWNWVRHAPRWVREVAEYGYSLPARRALVRRGRSFGPDFLYERYAFGNLAGVGAAAALGVPLVLEVNAPLALELERTRGLALPRLARRVEGSILRRAALVCAVTRVLGEMLVEGGVARERVVLTPNGVHPELYAGGDRAAARSDLGLGEVDGPVLGFVGYVRPWHRLDLVFEALTDPALARAHLVLVGSGPAEGELGELARRLGIEGRVHPAGSRAHGEIPALLAAFDVGLVPAINPYASPLKLHEYMAAGLAVVAPDQANIREVLEDGRNALLVAPGDAAALGAALARLVGDGELRRRLGAAAAATVVERELTWGANARRVTAAVEEL